MALEPYAQCDVLVIGSGGAGLLAAIHAARRGARVILLEKGAFGKSGCTILGEYSTNAAFGYADPRDNPAVHAADTLREGRYINDRRLVEVFVQEAPALVNELVEFGVKFDHKDGRLDQGLTPGNTYPRACFAGFHTGQTMMVGIKREAKRHANLKTAEGEIVTSLVMSGGRVVGARTVHWADGKPRLYQAGAVVLATGGSAQLYERATTSIDNTGDGMVLALEAGATLQDLEFVQFLPFVMCHPPTFGLNPAMPELLRRVEVRLTNQAGEAFVERTMPDWRYKGTRDILSQLLYLEIMGGRASPHGGLYLSVAHNPGEVIVKNLGVLYTQMLRQGIDLKRDPVEVAPSAHYHMGGIKIDEHGWTGVPGLFAAGEVTSGVHGANRLAGNALSEILVFGARAGEAAAADANSAPAGPLKEDEKSPAKPEWRLDPQGLRPAAFRARLQRTMWQQCGVVRSQEGLLQARNALQQLRQESETLLAVTSTITVYNREILDLLEARSMVVLAQAIVESAIIRTESRGAHYRADYPETDDQQWRVNLLVRREGSEINIAARPVLPAGPQEGGGQ
jgi:fumarate reductase (CoM/CoB) subunit A